MAEITLADIHGELLNVRYLLEVLASDRLRGLLEEVLTTPDRRRVWSLCNGSHSTAEIAESTGLTVRAVQLIIKELVERDLVTALRRGYPRRRFDHVPSEWRVIT